MGACEDRDGFAARQPERRADPRYSVVEDCDLLLVNQGLALRCCMVDLSLGGCRLRTSERLSAGARCPVEIAFKVNGIAFRMTGVVRWAGDRNLVGIRFVNIIPQRKAELTEVIGEREAAEAARAEAVNQLPASGTGPETAQAAADRNRRKQPRYSVETIVAVLLVEIGSTLRGRIQDLSLSGCRVRIDEFFPVGLNMRVETEFRLAGLPLRLGGVIQAIHGRDTIGIRFLELSDRKREQIEELIGEIQRCARRK
jgi:c-di-GMP-binding flagellar brake protein YcgR